MSERGRVALIFGAIGAIALGGGYYYFGIYRPKEVKQAARAEVVEWEKSWTAARACLLGAAPGSPRTSEALAIHELSPDPWDRGTCTPLMAKVGRNSDSPDTGLASVEAAWRELNHAASQAAQAFAKHASRVKLGVVSWASDSVKVANDPLPAALDALDAARLVLRASVGLADEATTAVPPLAVAEVVPLAIRGDAVASVDDSPKLSAHGLHAFGKTKHGADVQVDLLIGGKPRVARVALNGLRAIPDGTWGASATADGSLAIGALDESGGMASPIANGAKNVTSVVAAFGTLADGTVLYSAGSAFGVAHVKAGAVTLEPQVPVANGDVAVDADGRALAWWVAPTDPAASYARAFGFGAPQPVSIASASHATGCLAGDRAWLYAQGATFAVGATAKERPDVGDAVLAGCTPDGVLVTTFDGGGPSYQLCGDECKPLAMQPDVPAEVHGVANGQLVGATLIGSLLVVWRGPNAAATFYSVPGEDGGVLHRIFVDGKALVLLVEGDNVALVRVPLS